MKLTQNNQIELLSIPGYEITRIMAKTKMSTVLLSKRLEDDLDVVLKILFYTQDQGITQKLQDFMQEYKLISTLDHPNIVHIYERAFASEFAYIALEYMPNGNLSEQLNDNLQPERALFFMRQIASGLGAMHALNIIHRDLKPSNILLRNKNTLVIADFGTAKILYGKTQNPTNKIIGTPYYMSPEQGTGKTIDQRSDIYSLGALFYHLLTGKRPFTADSLAKLIHLHVHAPIPLLPKYLTKYQPLIDGMLAKEPDERFQKVDELMTGIDWVEQS